MNVLDHLLSNCQLLDLVNTTSEYINNPIMVFDITTKVLAISKKEILENFDDDALQDLVSHGHCTYEFMLKYQIPETIELTKQKKESFILDSHYAKRMRRILTPIMIDEEMYGYMATFEIEKEFHEQDLMIMDILSKASSTLLARTLVENPGKNQFQKKILLDLVSGELNDSSVIQELHKSFSITQNNYYHIFSIKTIDSLEIKTPLPSLVSYLEDISDSIQTIYFQFRIILLIGHNERKMPEKLMIAVKVFLEENYLVAGVSECFSNLIQLRKHFLQADHLLTLKNKTDKFDTLLNYNDLFLDFFSSKVAYTLDLEEFIMPEIKLLIQYDSKNDTNFFETICVYIEKQRNMVETANKLFIHRNTLRYRLQRIESITEIDLVDLRDYTRMALSCSIINFLHNE